MRLKIITHEKTIFDEEVDAITAKGVGGEFGILKDHAPYMTALDIGTTKVTQGNNTIYFSIMGGILQFKDNEAIILTDVGECGEDIDITRAKEAKARAESRLDEREAGIDAKRAEAALARAMARLKASLNK